MKLNEKFFNKLFNTTIFIVSIAFTGCASAPVVATKIDGPAVLSEKELIESPQECVQSTIAAPNDQYGYQGDIDPQAIHRDWVQIKEMLWGDYIISRRAYRNPDVTPNLRSALMIMQGGIWCVAYTILKNDQVQVFIYDNLSKCYLEESDLDLEAEKELRIELLKAAHFNTQGT